MSSRLPRCRFQSSRNRLNSSWPLPTSPVSSHSCFARKYLRFNGRQNFLVSIEVGRWFAHSLIIAWINIENACEIVCHCAFDSNRDTLAANQTCQRLFILVSVENRGNLDRNLDWILMFNKFFLSRYESRKSLPQKRQTFDLHGFQRPEPSKLITRTQEP